MIRPKEKHHPATEIEALKVIKITRSLKDRYTPQRLTVQVPNPSAVGGFSFSVQSKLIQNLHPDSMIACESFYMNNVIGSLSYDGLSAGTNPAVYFQYPDWYKQGSALTGLTNINIEIPDLTNPNTFDTSTNQYDYRIATIPTPPVFSRLAPPQEVQYFWGILNQQIGFKVSDVNFLNNNGIGFRITTNSGGSANLLQPLAALGSSVPYNLLPNLGNNGNPVNYAQGSGELLGISMVTEGNYTIPPTSVSITAPTGGGVTATGTIVLDALGARVVAVRLVNPGSGYSTAPTVSFNGGSGTAATATAYVSTVNSGNPLYNCNPPTYTQAPVCRFTLIIYKYFDGDESNDADT